MDIAPIFRHSLLLSHEKRSTEDDRSLTRVSRIAPELGGFEQFRPEAREGNSSSSDDAVVLKLNSSDDDLIPTYTSQAVVPTPSGDQQSFDSNSQDDKESKSENTPTTQQLAAYSSIEAATREVEETSSVVRAASLDIYA